MPEEKSLQLQDLTEEERQQVLLVAMSSLARVRPVLEVIAKLPPTMACLVCNYVTAAFEAQGEEYRAQGANLKPLFAEFVQGVIGQLSEEQRQSAEGPFLVLPTLEESIVVQPESSRLVN